MVKVDRNKCTVCGCCIDVCSVFALIMVDNSIVVNEDVCKECGICVRACAVVALSIE